MAYSIMRKKPKPALGSGLFEFDPQQQPQTPFALGSGLFGQGMPTPDEIASTPDGATVAPGAAPAEGGNPFDEKVSGLLNSPAFILGMNLLGASRSDNPWGTALQGTMAATGQMARSKREQQRIDQEQARFQQEQAFRQSQEERQSQQFDRSNAVATRNAETQETLANLSGQRLGLENQELAAKIPFMQAQVARMQGQTVHEGQKMTLEGQKAQREAQMQQMVANMLGSGGLFGEGVPQQPVVAPAGPTGKFGTPNAILDGLSRTESSGNPNALGPVLPDGTRAMGEFQFRPSTVDMLGKQGMKFDPMNPAQARDAADFYMNNLTQQHGGDLSKALAAYGGFVNKDPSEYIRKVTGQAPAPQAPQQGGSPDWQKIARSGAALGMLDPKMGGNLLDYAKLLQPQNTPAGSYRVGPNGAEYLPNPDAQARLQLDTQRLGMDAGKEQRAGVEASRKVTKENADMNAGFRAADMSLQRLEELSTDLGKSKGLDVVGGWSGAVGMHKIPGEGRDAAAKLETLKSKLVVSALGDLKKLSETGASGFGALSEKEGQRLETLIVNLEAAQSDEQIRAAVGKIGEFSRESRSLLRQHYKSLPGADPAALDTSGATAARQNPGTSTSPLSLDEYLGKHRPKRSDTAISPREAKGTIR